MLQPTNDNTGKNEPILNLPPATQLLCLMNVAVFLLQTFAPGVMTDDVLYRLAFVPRRYTAPGPLVLEAYSSLFTYMFIHGGWMHLCINVATLMAFGAGIERRLGWPRFLFLYVVTGVAAAAVHFMVYPQAETPVVGASGAISGLFGAAVMMMYGGNASGARGFYGLLPVVAVWIGSSVLFGIFGMPGVDSPIAWTAHVGGFIAGILLYKPLAEKTH